MVQRTTMCIMFLSQVNLCFTIVLYMYESNYLRKNLKNLMFAKNRFRHFFPTVFIYLDSR